MINRECPKCGDSLARVRHNPALDEMELECALCRYEWRLKPLDKLTAEDRYRAEMGKGTEQ
jgi:hypothetical protein